MRVISKFRDYYDIGLAYGIDPKCVYVREEDEIRYRGPTGDNPDWLRDAMADEQLGGVVRDLDRRRWDGTGDYVDEVVVLFCGRSYLGIRYGGSYRWSLDELISAIAAGPDCTARRVLAEGKKEDRTWFLPRHSELRGVYAAVDTLNARRGFLDGILVAAAAPIVLFQPGPVVGPRHGRNDLRATRNPELKHLGFASVLDPYQAFQELSMYLTNVIGIPEPAMCEVSDADKASKHGYNELSFRHPVK